MLTQTKEVTYGETCTTNENMDADVLTVNLSLLASIYGMTDTFRKNYLCLDVFNTNDESAG